MKKFLKQAIVLSCFLAIVSYNTSFAQATQDVATIGQDASMRKGVLPNGMTYYLHSTDVVKDKASYYIIQNVGSILENDNQQGLAHFLEHMAFNGTEAYPGKAFLNTMQEQGLVFGMDINAYTSFDETVYNINNVPTTPEMTGHGFQILHDWANGLLLTDEEIDAERGVIKEEWRQRNNGQMRIFEQTKNALFGNSLYTKRLPIGLMSVVENFDYKVMRDFYNDWYRTDLQAIAIVGDIDVDAMEAKIKEKFSAIPAVENPRERYQIEISDNNTLVYAKGMDKEVAREQVGFMIRRKKEAPVNTIAYLQESYQKHFAISIINERLSNLSQKPETPFLQASVRDEALTRIYNTFSVTVIPKENKQKEAFALAMNELQRALKFGFTKAELERQKTSTISSYENYLKTLADRSHKDIVGVMQNNYLSNEPMLDPIVEFEAFKNIADNITLDKLRTSLNSLYTLKNRSVSITAVEGRDNLTEAAVKAIIAQAENNTDLKPYVEETNDKGLMDGVSLSGGSITNTTVNNAIGYTEYTLSNGIKVYYKFVDKDKNQVSLSAISEGGLSLIPLNDNLNASMATNIAGASGIGEFSMMDLQKELSGKRAMANASISDFQESIGGNSTTKDVETLFQLTNLRFTKPRFDAQSFSFIKQMMGNQIQASKKSLKGIQQDSATITIFGENHPIRRPMTVGRLDELDLEKMEAIYAERFKNAADFKFFVVGDVKQETVEPLLEKYIATLPVNNTFETWNKDYTFNWVSQHIDKDIFLDMENPKGTVNIFKKAYMPFSLKNRYTTEVLGDLLQLRYLATLRESEGGTYGASVQAFLREKPKSFGGVYIAFDCNPEMIEKLIKIVHEEIAKIANGDIIAEDFDKTIKSKLKAREENKQTNGYDNSVIKRFVLDGYNMDDAKNFEDIYNNMTHKDIQEIAKKMISKEAHFYEIVFKPKKD